MSNTKYQQFYQLMIENNQKLFADFQTIHDGYMEDKAKWADKFHTEGRDVLDVIRDWERRLCSGMERGNNAVYSAKLSEKFWGEIKKTLPLVEEIGVKVKQTK